MSENSYRLGRQHYYEGLPVSAMDNAEPGTAIHWISGWLDAKLEHRLIRNKAKQCRNMNGTNLSGCRQ